MISADIRKQILGGETAGTAFVAHASDFDQIAAAVCGFLNTRGGVVFVGVSAAGHIVGVGGDSEEVRRRLEVKLQNEISPKALFTLSVDTEQGRPIISIEAPEGRDRPYVTDGRVYVRRGKRSTPVDPVELRQMVQGRSVETDRWERRPSLGLEFDDLDETQIEATIAEADEVGRMEFRSGKSLDGALRELSLIAPGGYPSRSIFRRYPVRPPEALLGAPRLETSRSWRCAKVCSWRAGAVHRPERHSRNLGALSWLNGAVSTQMVETFQAEGHPDLAGRGGDVHHRLCWSDLRPHASGSRKGGATSRMEQADDGSALLRVRPSSRQ